MRGEEYFISAYSDVFNAKYRVHTASLADVVDGKPSDSVTSDMTAALPESAHTLEAYYQGSSVFAPLGLGQVTVLSGDEGYHLIVCDKNGNEPIS